MVWWCLEIVYNLVEGELVIEVMVLEEGSVLETRMSLFTNAQEKRKFASGRDPEEGTDTYNVHVVSVCYQYMKKMPKRGEFRWICNNQECTAEQRAHVDPLLGVHPGH